MSNEMDMAGTLAALIAKATDEDLLDGGRYFDESYTDFAQCSHGDTGEYLNRNDGELVELLWNNRRHFLALQSQLTAAKEALFLLREFTLRNATQWQTGANHHHPIYPMIAELLVGMPSILSPTYSRFVHAENRDTLSTIGGGK